MVDELGSELGSLVVDDARTADLATNRRFTRPIWYRTFLPELLPDAARVLYLDCDTVVTARELDCQHIWNAHAASARKAGVRNELVDALRDRKALPPLAADEAAVVHYGREFFRTRRVSRGAFQAALEQLGRQGVVELALVMGNYSLLALLINSFDTDLPPDRTEPLLPV